MLQDVLTTLEQRLRDQAPSLLEDVRTALDLVRSETLALSRLDDPGRTVEVAERQPSWSLDDERTEEVARVAVTPAADRYADLGVLGAGGMGEVRRVRDRELNRVVAMKLVHAEVAGRGDALARFVEEVQTTAQLQHPGIVPVYDAGRLSDGRVYFTMKEVRGRTLGQVIREVHEASGERWERADGGWTFRRLVAALHQASLAVAFAHERGVVHRDLKPANVMVGDYGEVQVMDWGLAKVAGRAARSEDDVVVDAARDATRVGRIMGTPAYMAPEQAAGDIDALDARTDVYALGAMLYEVLSGRPPYLGADGASIVRQVLDGPPPPPRRGAPSDVDAATWLGDPGSGAPPGLGEAEVAASAPGASDLPDELLEACHRAMARQPAERHPTATAFAADLQAWLDGSKRREQALEVVARADATIPEAEALRTRAAALRQEAEDQLARVPAWAPEEEKLESWARQDEAGALERRAARLSVERDRLLAASLTWVPDLPEAHAALAEDLRRRHEVAEAARDAAAAARAETLLRAHTEALPEGHPVRRSGASYLRGTGALTVVTDVEAEVELLRFEPHGRRLVATPVRSLGRAPLVEVPLEMGSYLLLLRHPGRAVVRYPVHIGRGTHWDGVRPGDREPSAIALPPADALGPDDCYVPAGWYRAGSTADYAAVPPVALWCDAFVMRRFPVTNREYMAFLDDLVGSGREDEALQLAPRERGGTDQELGPVIYGRGDDGRFVLRPDADGDIWDPDWPVFLVDWYGATAYAAWLASREGVGWRLPWDLEWEKAARGVDGRLMPWGDGFDPSFCNMRASHPARALPSRVDSFPLDESVYGIRGLGGNVMEWCVDVFTPAGPPLGDRVVRPYEDEGGPAGSAQRTYRGGRWGGFAGRVRAPVRLDNLPVYRTADLGFRLARSRVGVRS